MSVNLNCPDVSGESLRLEAVTTCVGFDDILDVTLEQNHAHFDSFIVVTSHDDYKTQQVAQKHGRFVYKQIYFKKTIVNSIKEQLLMLASITFNTTGGEYI